MKNKKFLFVFTLCSFLVSAAVLAAALFAHSFTDLGCIFNAVTVGLILSVTSFLSFAVVCLVNRMSKRTKAQIPKLFSAFTAVILVILFFFGVVGQIVYSIGTNTYEVQTGEDEKRETVEYGENTDIILMLDRSSSLDEINKKVESACNIFFEGVSSDCNMGGGSFADFNNFEDIQKMDTNGKAKLKAAIECKNANIGNGTKLSDALNDALMKFKKRSPDKHKAIVIFSDGCVEDNYEPVYSELIKQGVKIYSIRPDSDFYGEKYLVYSLSPTKKVDIQCSENFLKFVKDSGGEDFSVIPSKDSSSEQEQKAAIEKILNLLNEITKRQEEKVTKTPIYETRTDIVFSKGLILYDSFDEQNLYRLVVRACFFIVYTFLIQLLFFRKIKLSSVASVVVCSALSWLLVWASCLAKTEIYAILGLALFMFTLVAFGKQDKEAAYTEERNKQDNEKT